jgi:D-sedoheptulose 7-phosphate isomerase
MSRIAGGEALGERVGELLTARTRSNAAFFEAEADRLARCCHRMAERFARGGRLLALGGTPVARSDARHVTVEFVHPVIVGKRALPAIGLTAEGGSLRRQLESIATPDDIVIAFGLEDAAGPWLDDLRAALTSAVAAGCLTMGFGTADAEWTFTPEEADPFVRQELVETLYHVLWELVHVFFDHRGLLEGRKAAPVHDTGASSFLYPFLGQAEHDLEAIVDDVRRSVLAKAEDVGALREQTLTDNRDVLLAAAAELRARFDAGGKLLTLGNGGSATDSMDAVADYREPPHGWASRAALDLTEDTGIITAVANDVGVAEIFQRQIIAHGESEDVVMAFSTSGGSDNVLTALREARSRGLPTIAFVGYDGGSIAADGLADHLVVTRSQHVPRVQEAQASAHHVLRELVELVGP